MENLTVPIIITDCDGRVTYKNRAAMHCIPSPRRNAVITDHIDKRLPAKKLGNAGMYVQQIKNGKSIFNRALVVPYGEKEKLWIFTFQLQLMEPEDLAFVTNVAADTLYTRLLNMAEEYKDTKDKKYFKRYQRWSEEMLSAMRCLAHEKENQRFRIVDTLASLHNKTAELAASLNFRVDFEEGFCQPQCKLKFYFSPFATVYSQLLSLTLRLSSDRCCSLRSAVIYDRVHLFAETKTDFKGPLYNASMEELSKIFHSEALNIILLDGLIGYYEYDISCDVENSLLTLHLSVPVAIKNPIILACPPPEMIEQMNFSRANKRALAYLESVLKA